MAERGKLPDTDLIVPMPPVIPAKSTDTERLERMETLIAAIGRVLGRVAKTTTEPNDTERFVNCTLTPFLNHMEEHFDTQATALAAILEQLTPEGCGHENWEEVTTSGAPQRTFHCAEPGCTEQKTEPW